MAAIYRGQLTNSQEDFRQAADDLTRAIELNYAPASWAHVGQGLALAGQEAWDQAIGEYNKAIALDQKMAWAYLARGQAHARRAMASTGGEQRLDDLRRAIDDCNQALKLKFTPPSTVYAMRSMAYAALGGLNQAMLDANDAAEQAPGSASMWNNRCWLGAVWGQPADALAACERAVALNPRDGRFYESRGVVRARLGRYQEASDDFERYLKWAKRNYQYERHGVQREDWIKALEAGHDPFGEATLAELRRKSTTSTDLLP
jgi:tetratricopeptide (TPR) repeat protein